MHRLRYSDAYGCGSRVCEAWQGFSLKVINANRASLCYGKSALH